MTYTKEQAKEEISGLIKRLEEVMKDGKERDYSEADVGSKFILPLIEKLGWSIENIDEVKEQQRTLVGPVDYSLNIDKKHKILIEIKKFERLDGYRIKGGKKQTFPEQAIEYAWSKKADWALLTNFKETRLYYSHVKKPEEGLIFKLSFSRYLEQFDKLWILSKESVVSGVLDTYEKKRTREEIDVEILKDLYDFRILLTKNIHLKNPELGKGLIRESVQKILDRLIVIRFAEDRNIIPSDSIFKQLKAWKETVLNKEVRTFMMDLKNSFRDIDFSYNTKLFEEHPCEDLKIDNNVIEEVITCLYKYNFEIISSDVLGAVYEGYIGHILKESEEGVEITEDKKVRKSFGIYYTPTYVVDYIAKNTLGELLKDKTTKEVSKIRVLDLACGSGSFLIKAFDYLKEYYDEYNKKVHENARRNNRIDRLEDLIPDVEKKILTENLYGVDLDEQAAEIASVNLMLKALKKGEKLPLILDENIKVGNSLISGSEDELKEYFRGSWKDKKPFNWEEEFGKEGFDIVIGNPPYVQMQKEPESIRNYLRKKYQKNYSSQNDLWYYFMMKGLDLLNEGGLLGFITSRYFIEATHAKKLRDYILKNSCIKIIIDFGKVQIFKGIGTHTSIIILEKDTSMQKKRESNEIKNIQVLKWKEDNEILLGHIAQHFSDKAYRDNYIEIFSIHQGELDNNSWVLASERSTNILDKLKLNTVKLSEICDIGTGIKSGYDKAFVVNEKKVKKYKMERTLLRKWIKNSDIHPYYIWATFESVIYLTNKIKLGDYPGIEEYMSQFKDVLEEKWKIRGEDANWYELYRPREYLFVTPSEKLICPYKATCNKFAYDTQEYCGSGDIYAIISKDDNEMNLKYILALLNSKLLNYYYKIAGKKKGEVFEYYTEPLSNIPIHEIDFSNPSEKIIHDKLVALTDKMIDTNRKVNSLHINFCEMANITSETGKLNPSLCLELSKTKRKSRGLTTEYYEDKYLMVKDSNENILRIAFDNEITRRYVKLYLESMPAEEINKEIGKLSTRIQHLSIHGLNNVEYQKTILGEYDAKVKERDDLIKLRDETDRAINQRVYELYRLREEEIETIEQSL